MECPLFKYGYINMDKQYPNVTTRFLRADEKLISSDDQEMPLVIEANSFNDLPFLTQFLNANSESILKDISKYGAVLLRGFQVSSEHDFEKAVLSVRGLRGIRDAFMSEEGRTQVDGLEYVLHTNAVYKTGGTLYLGGFHSENYYSPDVPAYICFYCQQPSLRGGETGIINMSKVYAHLPEDLQKKLEQNTFFVSKWLLSDVAKRYQISIEDVKNLAQSYNLPILGKGKHQFIAFYKPSVYVHPTTGQRSLQINLFELLTLNKALRQCFMADYAGQDWFWHRFIWHLPASLLKTMEVIYLSMALLFYSPKECYEVGRSKFLNFIASTKLQRFPSTRVGECFSEKDTQLLAQLLRQYYVSCLWQKGDILLIDNTKVVHAGMPGAGQRKIRAMICNPLDLTYQHQQSGTIVSKESQRESIGSFASNLSQDSC